MTTRRTTTRRTTTRRTRTAHGSRGAWRAGVAPVVAGVFVLAGLAGCSSDRVGTAAVIEGRTVSVDDLQTKTQEHLAVVPGGNAGDAQRAMLQRMIVSAAIDTAARDAGVRVRDGEIATERAAVLESVGGPKGLIRTLAQSQQPTVLAPEDIDRWIKDRLLFRAIAEEIAGGPLSAEAPETEQAITGANEALRAAGEQIDVEVSPRYGTWDPESGITSLVSGGLSKTAAELDDDGS